MSQRPGLTKWLWCVIAVYMGPGWTRAVSVAVQPVQPVRAPQNVPATIEAQAKFFQDFFSVQLSPYKIEFGHVCEDPNTWEQRYEKKDFKNHRDMGKVRWGDKLGGYGEHYWDLNHAGNAHNIGNEDDDGSYNHDLDHAHEDRDNSHDHDTYDEPSEQLSSYSIEEYDPEQAAKYDESGRAKRAHPRIKTERKFVKEEESYEGPPRRRHLRKIKERSKTALQEDKVQEQKETNEKSDRNIGQNKHDDQEDTTTEKQTEYEEEDQQEYYVKEKEDQNQREQEPQYYHRNQNEEQKPQAQPQPQPQPQPHPQPQPQYYQRQENKFVPYEQGAGVRQHQHPGLAPAASSPRLFLEPTTGHVVDRATGQAYVLQPIAMNNYY